MTYYPGHYIKRWQDATNEYIQLSMWDFDGAQYIEPYYRGTFKSIIDTTTYGNTETTKILRSYAGSVPTGSLTIDKFRDYAGNKTDNEMSIGDWRDFDFQCLYLIKYADYNSQSKVGLGITNSSYSSVQANGLGSAHTTLSGRDGYIGTNGSTSVWCLGLCDFWGNQWEFVDGITINNRQAYIATNPADYTNEKTTSPYTTLGYTNWSSNGYPKATGYDSGNQLIAFPSSANSGTGSDSTGLCDYYWQDTGVFVVLRGGHYYATTGAGAFFFACSHDFTFTYAIIGCRLLKTA